MKLTSLVLIGMMSGVLCQSSLAATLSPVQMERLKVAKNFLEQVDTKSLEETKQGFLKNRFIEENLQIYEAVANTYRDMITEYPVETLAKRKWLYSMVLLNLAYFQFGGGDSEENQSGLNIVIRRKLKQYLSTDVLNNPDIFYSLE